MLKVRGRMHGNETDPRTDLNVHVQIRIITGQGTRECGASELEFSVGVSSTIPCSSKRLNVPRERRETTLFNYSHLNVRANVN